MKTLVKQVNVDATMIAQMRREGMLNRAAIKLIAPLTPYRWGLGDPRFRTTVHGGEGNEIRGRALRHSARGYLTTPGR